MMHFSDLPTLVNGQLIQLSHDRPVKFLVTDSRKPVVHEGSLFFAISGLRNDGHNYIEDIYRVGVRQFIVERDYDWQAFPEANSIKVNSSVAALQGIARHHRQQFSIPVFGITGSNGKTIVKEWLYQLMSSEYNIIKNPGSYNSQIGVPLSVWQMQPHHMLGIFEAGVSAPGEMDKLEEVICPTWGIFTNIGTAHEENFSDRKTKVEEKLKLFSNVEKLIYCQDHTLVHSLVKEHSIPSLTWGKTTEAEVVVSGEGSNYRISWANLDFTIDFPFAHEASVENAMHCLVVMLMLGYNPEEIQTRLSTLKSVPMRLELKEGINHCQVIDDTYNNDVEGLQISIDFLLNQKHRSRKIIVLSDILQSGLKESELLERVSNLVHASQVDKFVGIGAVLSAHREAFKMPSSFYATTGEFEKNADLAEFKDAVVLVKGGRVFQFERIVRLLQKKVHGTVMEIDLGALVHNLNVIRSKLKAGTRLMAMVKAFAYGSGSVEIANLLQFHQIDYLGVAYVDEGVMLRENHITTPIMVMNPSDDGFPSMLKYDLQPEIYNFKILQELIEVLDGHQMNVHLKLDTGMNRLGFEDIDLSRLIELLKAYTNLKVVSIFSHLAGADDSVHDDFSRHQVDLFLKMAKKIADELGIKPLLHILNTAGIFRLPDYQLDMVRLGIGLYGVDTSDQGAMLQPVATLKTVISQIRNVKAGETVGYSRKGIAGEDMKLATIAIGYADGFSRAFSNGAGLVLINGKRAPVVGNVCMDMTMVDITGIEAQEGDEVILFGAQLPIGEVAARIKTIPYEILTNTSERVKRVFVAESW